MATKNIIVFGEAGSGKSSVVNLLIGENVAAVSDSAIGCTLSYQMYTHSNWALFDTVGLSEGTQGAVDAVQAFKQLKSLLESLSTGVSLLIMVIEKSRIKKMMEQNYKLFVKAICMENVPVLLVVTKCEDYENMQDWWLQNMDCFENYGMIFTNVVCGCAKDPSTAISVLRPIIEEKRNLTKINLFDKINKTMLKTPWILENAAQWLKAIAQSVLKVLSTLLGLHGLILDPIRKQLIDWGFTREDADLMIEEIKQIR